MTYLRVEWLHHVDDPIELLCELDAERYETRKVEIFRDGSMDFAASDGEFRIMGLGEVPTPSNDQIAADPQFRVTSISRDDFECAWQAAKTASAL